MAVNYYNARSDEQLRKIAQDQYKSYYDQLRLAAQQKQQREATALEGQRAGIQRSYQQQIEDSERSYRQAYTQADREALRRGMQRSSYTAQVLAGVNREGARAADRIREAGASAEGNLDAQIAQSQTQLAEQLAGYDINQAQDVMSRYNELQSEEYDRNREYQQFAESIRQSDQQIAYNYVSQILAAGKDPSDDLLARAGLSRQDANAIKVQQATGGGGGGYVASTGSYTPKKSTTPSSPTGDPDNDFVNSFDNKATGKDIVSGLVDTYRRATTSSQSTGSTAVQKATSSSGITTAGPINKNLEAALQKLRSK